MPQWLEYPVKGRADFESLKRRLDSSTPSRYPDDWSAFRAKWDALDCPRGLAPGSFYGHTLQRWVGTEQLCIMFYDAPALVQ